jgi:exopolysaccharide biosynthesis polyprenyl glycosylphosphotransferase
MGLILAFLEAGVVLGAVGWVIVAWASPWPSTWLGVAAMVAPALAVTSSCLVAFYYNDLYDLRRVPGFAQYALRLPRTLAIALVLAIAVYALLPDRRVGPAPFVSALLATVGLLIPFRGVSYGVMRSRLFVERVLILGTGPMARALIKEIEAHPTPQHEIIGLVADGPAPRDWQPPRPALLGPLTRLGRIVEEARPDRIIDALGQRRGRLPIRQLLESQMRCGFVVEDAVQVYERLTGKVPIDSLTPSAVLFAKEFEQSAPLQWVSRTVNLLLAAVGLLVFAPLLAIIALAIKLDSGGPVLFTQRRLGLHGRCFTLLKFRTMNPVADAPSEWARDNGHRITRVGRWLRNFRLDELPQLVNVVRGDMNLIGPRPHPVSNFGLFLERIPYYPLRCRVRPGITGWAQVRYGYANNLEEETEKMRYDLYYVKHASLWLDLRIFVDTVKIVLMGREARGRRPVAAAERNGAGPANGPGRFKGGLTPAA